ncbi:DUF6624 domain-containing protein [Streptomyces sp. CAU 1734]|uniref:DUF6624 domain-containing protein n=1 Tax=Streptomyces sp. CAU 1734 TaxID=3140360 RepID=UPI003260C91F
MGDLWEVRPVDLAAARTACRRLPERQPPRPGITADLTGRAEAARAWRADARQDGDGPQPALTMLTTSHVRALRRIIEVHGWPGFGLVGAEGSLAALEIALLCGEATFLRRLLRVMEVPLRNGEAVPVFRLLLHDRACVLEGQRQWYGTQQQVRPPGAGVLWPVEEPGLLAVRRADAGFEPLVGAVFHEPAAQTAA